MLDRIFAQGVRGTRNESSNLGDNLELAAVLELEAANRQLDGARHANHQTADLPFQRRQVQASLVAVDGGVEVQGEAGVLDRLGGELLVRNAQPIHVQLPRERHTPSGETRLDGGVDFRVLGFENRSGQDVRDLVEREALGAQGHLSVNV